MKRFLKELNKEEFKKVLEKNSLLYEKVVQNLYENNMFYQNEEYENLNIKNYVEMRNYYNTFYLKLKDDIIGFYENISTDYLCNDGIKIYNSAKIYYKRLQNTKNDDIYCKNFDLLEEKMKDLLKIIEKQLQEYENVNEDDIFYELYENIEYYEDIYVNDDFEAFKHIEYEKSYF